MSGRIFAKFDIAPKAQLSPEHFETCSVQYGYRTLQIVYLGFVMSLTSGQVNFVTSPIISQWAKNQVPHIPIRGTSPIRGQFHKAKNFVITKIIFVITNISNFVFSISTVC